ncbi:MAG: hypothetical protein ACUVS7_19485 [Bryobacteraceae bacterium]
MNWEIYTAQGDGAYPVRLTANNKVDSLSNFNRGTTQIAFHSNRDGNYEICRAIADGGFEEGDLTAWNPTGEVPPTPAGSGHTGDFAALLGETVLPPMVTPTVPFTMSAVLTASGGLLTSSLAISRPAYRWHTRRFKTTGLEASGQAW